MAKVKSTAVKVFPSAFRGPSSGVTKYNPEARLNTEFNVTNLINRLASKDSFVIDWNSGTKVIKFNIHGYYFEANLTEFLGVGGTGASWTNLYASIKVIPFITDEGEPSAPNTKYKGFTLVGANDTVGFITDPSGRILDVDDAGTYMFEGLDLTQTPRTPASDVYELHLLSGGPSAWAVPLTSILKFEATDVEGLPKINNDLTLDTSDTVFAPTTAGTAGQALVSAGGTSAPVWTNQSDLIAGKATQLETSRNLWGRSFNGTSAISGAITGTGNITPTTTNTSNIGASDNVYANVYATNFIGALTGNADTVTNGVVTTGSYTDPSWLTISKSKVGLGNVDNTSDANKPVSSATQTALNLKANLASPTFTGTVGGITASMVGLGNVTNESKATMFTSPTFTGTVSGITASMVGAEPANANIQSHISSTSNPHGVTASQVGLGNVTNESKTTMFTNPTFTGTVTGVTKSHVGLGNVDNTSDANKPVSTATQTALNLKANLASPTFTGTIGGLYTNIQTPGSVTVPSGGVLEYTLPGGVFVYAGDVIRVEWSSNGTNWWWSETTLLSSPGPGAFPVIFFERFGVSGGLQTYRLALQIGTASTFDATASATLTFRNGTTNGTSSVFYVRTVQRRRF